MSFLLISRCLRFKTVKERWGFAGNSRYKTDFLYFVKDDIHWFLIPSLQTFMLLYIYIRNRSQSKREIDISIVIWARIAFDFIVLITIFFDKDDKRLYRNFLVKKVLGLFISLILDIYIFIHIINSARSG